MLKPLSTRSQVMQSTLLKFSKVFSLLTATALGSALFLSTARAAVTSPLDLATIPLANSPTVSIQPNLLFIMDDSSSMARDYMPDWATSSTASLRRNASYNTVAYNPEIRYLPPANFTSSGLDVTTYPSQTGMTTATGASSASKPNWRQVKNNPYRSTATSNIETESGYYYIVPGEYCTRRDLKVCVAQSGPTATHPYPAPLRWCNSSTNATTATPAANSCQASRLSGYTNMRAPTQRAAKIRITNSSSCSTVTGLVVNGKQIMDAAITCSSTTSTTATRIASAINACTYSLSGNCTIAGYSATANSNEITITGPTSFSGNPNAPTTTGGSISTTIVNGFNKSNSVPGELLFVPITSGINSYPLPGSTTKAPGRTDCAGTTCTYVEEMTNYANWWAYYRTREQMMKTAVSLAFKDIGDDFRVGFMTTSTRATYMKNFGTFNTANKAAWYTALFKSPADRNTPLRGALSKAGRIYANETTAKRGVFTDPIEYECQQNFTLLTTDGFWNTNDETSTYAGGPLGLDGKNVGNQDSAAAGTPRPMREGTPARPDTLADVAKYYYDNDLRTTDLGNCIGALGTNVCQSPAPSTANKKQKMVTMTLGLGVDGTLAYTTDYKTDPDGDFAAIKNGSKNWPDPINNTEAERIDDLWHAAVNGGGTYFSAKNPTDLVNQLRDALASVAVKVGSGAAAATSTLNPVAGDNFGYVASYTSGLWTGNLEKRSIDTTTGAFGLSALSCVEDVLPTASCISPSSIRGDGLGGYY
jgi:type IV pilus assembly protein PilY1